MDKKRGQQRVPGYRIEAILESIVRFRDSWGRYHRPDDVNHLLRLFRKVQLARGYILDYLALGSAGARWIWPYARREAPGIEPEPPGPLQRIPPDRLVSRRRGAELRPLENETLYSLLEYEHSPEGLVEYGLFVNELWATKSAERERDWLELEPLVTRHKFDSTLRRQSRRLVSVSKPDSFDPEVVLASAGGTFSLLAFQPGPWRRILRVEIEVGADGGVEWRPGEVVANLAGRA